MTRQTFAVPALALALTSILSPSALLAQTMPTKPVTPASALTQEQLVAEIQNLGGAVKTAGGATNGAIEEISFTYTHKQSSAPTGKRVPPYDVTDALLAQFQGLPKLTTLELNMCPKLTDAGMKNLQEMPQLQHLALPGPCVTDATMAHLAGLTNLVYLRLSGTERVTAAGWEKVEGMKQLQILLIAETKIGDLGMTHLKGLTQLKEISLYGTPVTDAGAEVLKELKNLQSVRCGPKVSKEEVAKLKETLPNCRFWR